MDNTRILLPREIDLEKCISLNSSFKDARVDLSQLPRLVQSCIRIEGDVIANVSFEKDLNGIRLIKGTADVDVVLLCQRCNHEYVESLELDFELTPDIDKAKAYNIESSYDFIEFNDNNKIDLYELIEDGLILEIPIIPRHYDDEECARPGDNWTYGELDAKATESPFASLAALKESLAQGKKQD